MFWTLKREEVLTMSTKSRQLYGPTEVSFCDDLFCISFNPDFDPQLAVEKLFVIFIDKAGHEISQVRLSAIYVGMCKDEAVFRYPEKVKEKTAEIEGIDFFLMASSPPKGKGEFSFDVEDFSVIICRRKFVRQ